MLYDLSAEYKKLAKRNTCALFELREPSRYSPSGYLYSYIQNPSSTSAKFKTVGAINSIWQSWNCFCRAYWIVYMRGGQSVDGTLISSRCNKMPCSTEEALSRFLVQNGGYGKYKKGRSLPYYCEPTWGDPDKLGNAISKAGNDASLIKFDNAVSILEGYLGDLQLIRNSAIHPSAGSISDLNRSVAPKYSIRTSYGYSTSLPMDLVYSIDISSGKIAIERWVEIINSALHNI